MVRLSRNPNTTKDPEKYSISHQGPTRYEKRTELLTL